jgi:trans-aconitate methyltransferase
MADTASSGRQSSTINARGAHVLDLGGGTGALSWAMLDRLAGARVTVLEVDADLLAEARRRLAGFGDRVSFQQARFSGSAAGADAVVASLALHHVHDLETKTALYRAIYDALSPHGVLLNPRRGGDRGRATERTGV